MTVATPDWTAVSLGGVNQWTGSGLAKRAVVLHIAEGSADGCISWFKNPAAKASSNFLVDRAGRVSCFIDPRGQNAPFANGILAKPDAAVQALVTRMSGVNPNFWTVSIEHEGFSGDPLPPAQLQASATLTAWLCDHFGIPADEDHLLGHYEFDSVTRAGCPGWSRQTWVAYEQAIDQALQPHYVPSLEERVIAAIHAEFAHQAAAGFRVLAPRPDAFHEGAPGR